MAIAAYDSDLTSANGGELTIASIVGDWDESSDGGYDDAGTMVAETNFYIQGTECISAQFTKTGVGTIIFIGTTFTVDTDGAILIWAFWASPSSLETYANGGVRTLVGNSLGAFNVYKASGNNFEPNPFGGWYNYAVDPASATVDTAVGGPTGVWSHVGIAINATAQSRGNPQAVDAIRVGRCTMEVTAGQAGDYGTFTGMGSFDDSSGQRYALFQSVAGSFRWQGLMSLGVTATAVDFRDSNVAIVIANTPQVGVNFNKIEVHNTSSNIEWNSISINAYGVNDLVASTASAGKFEMIDGATLAFNSCTFIDMLDFVFLKVANPVTISTTTWQKCGQITQGGASFDSCTVDNSAAAIAMVVDNLSLVTNTTFISDGTGYAIDLGTIAATTAVSWNNTATGYAGTDGVTGNEVIRVIINSGQTLTVNVSGTAPTFHKTGTGTLNVVSGATLTITNLQADTEVRVHRTSDGTAIDGIENATSVVVGSNPVRYEWPFVYTTNEAVYIQIISLQYEIQKIDITLDGVDGSLPIQQRFDRNYVNP